MIIYDPDFERWGLQEPRRFDSGLSVVLAVLDIVIACVVIPLAIRWLLRFLGLVQR